MFDELVVVPPMLCQRILDAFHAAHQRIVKSCAKVRQIVWWPKISTFTEQHIGSYASCAH